jgi:hypothetical protein
MAVFVEVNRPGEAFLCPSKVPHSVQNGAKQAIGVGIRRVSQEQTFAHGHRLLQSALISQLLRGFD